MPSKIDLTGMVFGALRVLSQAEHKNGRTRYLTECVCGKQTITFACHLSSGKTKSCGCMKGASISKSKTTHGLSYHPLRGVHRHMLDRCKLEKGEAFHNYGGRGITVCERWNNFLLFYEDMIDGYKPSMTLERINVNGNYQPSNCKWATRKEQGRNTRVNRIIVYKDEKVVLAELAERFGMPYNLLHRRLERGWSVDDAVNIKKIEKYSHPPLKANGNG